MARACPKCRTIALGPATGALNADELPARAFTCPGCSGLWLPHSIIELWQKAPLVELVEGEIPESPPEEDQRTGLCPEGHGILIRARVETNPPFHLERCAACAGVWLDAGEWQRLAAHQFLDHLDDLWDPSWQREERRKRRQVSIDQALAAAIGAGLFKDLVDVAKRLKGHPARAQALAWLAERLVP